MVSDNDMNYPSIPVHRNVLNENSALRALVSPDHFDFLNTFVWYLSPSGYAWTFIENKPITMHRMVMELDYKSRGKTLSKKKIVDHKENDRLDNRLHMLRVGSVAQNNRNRQVSRNNKLGLKGVYRREDNGKFRATIRHNNVFYHLGDYEDRYVAALAYNVAATALWGDWAWLNECPADFDMELYRKDLSTRVMAFAVAGGLS